MRQVRFTSFIFLIMVGAVDAAPVPAGASRPKFVFPDAVGTVWVYLYPQAEVIEKVVETNREVSFKFKGSKKVAVISIHYLEPNKNWALSEKVSLSRSGISILEDCTNVYGNPIPWVNLDALPGESWEVKSWYKNRTALEGTTIINGRIMFERTEKITVPAGEFLTYKMVAKGDNGWSETRWYSSGVGLVKWINNANQTIVLKSYTPGEIIAPMPREAKR